MNTKKTIIYIAILLPACTKQTSSVRSSNISESVSLIEDIELDSYGQSLSVGGSGGAVTSIYSRTQKYNSVKFNVGVRATDFAGLKPKSFIPLTEQYNSSHTLGETPCTAAADMFNQTSGKEKGYRIFGIADGQSSQSVDSLSKGGRFYLRIGKHFKMAKTISEAEGHTFSMGAIMWTQGEKDYSINTTYKHYYNSLNKLQENINTDIAQTRSIPFIIGQTSSSNRTNAGIDSAPISLAQLQLCIDNPNFIFGAPMYMLNFLSDNVHLSDTGYRVMGAYYGYAFKKFLIDGKKDFLYIKSASRIGKIIRLSLHVPVSPIVIDTINVTNPGNYGFVAKNSIGSNIQINSISIKRDSITIICNEIPFTISYAINGSLKKSGRMLGQRGNIRDSQGNNVVDSATGWKLHNWLPISRFKL